VSPGFPGTRYPPPGALLQGIDRRPLPAARWLVRAHARSSAQRVQHRAEVDGRQIGDRSPGSGPGSRRDTTPLSARSNPSHRLWRALPPNSPCHVPNAGRGPPAGSSPVPSVWPRAGARLIGGQARQPRRPRPAPPHPFQVERAQPARRQRRLSASWPGHSCHSQPPALGRSPRACPRRRSASGARISSSPGRAPRPARQPGARPPWTESAAP